MAKKPGKQSTASSSSLPAFTVDSPVNVRHLNHGQIISVSMELIYPNDYNPNEMSDAEFNMLVENLEDVDNLDPVLVTYDGKGKFVLIDGEHRYEAERLRDTESLLCVYAHPDRVPEIQRKFQTLRMNKIRGRINQKKFNALVKELMESGEYTFDQLAHEMGFVDEDEFMSMVETTRESLPTEEMKKDFDKAVVSEEIKTIDDLSLILNKLFTKYSDTLPYHFMLIDFMGRENIWVRMKDRSVYTKIMAQARSCMETGVTFDSVLCRLLLLLNVPEFVAKNRDHLDAPDESRKDQENS